MKNKIFMSLATSILCGIGIYSQNKELKFKLNDDGSHFVKATFLNQVWVRYNQNNPGTTINGYSENETFDIGLRRTRIQLLGQLSDKVFFYTQFGTNNLSYNGARKQGLFFHDALGEFKIHDEHLSIGTGLTGWSGLSRYASPSIGSILSLDAPLYQQATNDISDQFIRKFSVYAKGKLGKVDYRLAITKPMSVAKSSVQGTGISSNSLFSPEPPKPQFQGYVMYQFLDKESNLTPYNKGSYLGQKNVFNIGGGFIYQQNAMWHSENYGADTVHSNLELFAVDVFYDHVINTEKKNAITAYASFSSNNYGKNYIRNVGVMNPANGVNSSGTLNGAGDALPLIGTGTTAYTQVGFIFRKDLLGDKGTIQPYTAMQYSNFDFLKDPMVMYEGGVNWIIDGHRTKVSIQYQSRPVFEMNGSGDYVNTKRKGMFVTQLQISI